MACALIPGLPHDLALLCLARLPLASHPLARAVCRAWRSALLLPHLYQLRATHRLSQQCLYVCSYGPLWQAFDPLSRRWMCLPPLPTPFSCLFNFGVAVASRRIWVMGGESEGVDPVTGDRELGGVSREVWAWDPTLGQWQQRACMHVGRKRFACCVVNGKIVVAGGLVADEGFGSSKASASVEVYDPEEDRWSYGAELKACIGVCRGVILGGKMHVVQHKNKIAEIFDPLENNWMKVEWNLEAFPMAELNGELYTMAELNGELYTLQSGRLFRDGRLIAYSPQLNRIAAGMAAMGSDLYVFGGFSSTNLDFHSRVGLNDCIIICVTDGSISVGPTMTLCRGTVLGHAVLEL